MIKAERYSILGASLGVVLLAICIFWGPRLTPYRPNSFDPYNMGMAPSGNHWCGNNDIGADECAVVLAGANLQARLTATAMVMAVVLGGLLGVVAGAGSSRMRTVILASAWTLRDIPPLIVPSFSIGLALLPTAFFWNSDWPPVVVAMLLTWPSYALLAGALVRESRATAVFSWWRALGAGGVRLVTDMWGVMLIIVWLDMAGLGSGAPSPAWGVLLHDALRNPVSGGWQSSLLWWPFVFPAAAIGVALVALWLLARTVRQILLSYTSDPAWWAHVSAYDVPAFWFVRPQVVVDRVVSCPHCGQENAAARQYCGDCAHALVVVPVEAKAYTRPPWVITVFMVLSFGIYIVPWCFHACRFVNAVWIARGSSRRRSPWVWCPLALVPLVNCIAIYRLAADIKDATGVVGPPSAGTLSLAFLFSYFATVASISPPFGAFGPLVGILGRAGCVLSMQGRINQFFEQDTSAATRGWEPGRLEVVGFIVGVGVWATLILYLTR